MKTFEDSEQIITILNTIHSLNRTIMLEYIDDDDKNILKQKIKTLIKSLS